MPLTGHAELPDDGTLRVWVQEMKDAPRGPFQRIRWFCKDGTILAPKESCQPHGGGVQHGEWNARTQQMRAGGYAIANVFADLDVQQFLRQPAYAEIFQQMVVEQFLIVADDGWVLRQAYAYRGALQAEDETAGARRLLLGLLGKSAWTTQGFVPLRAGARLLPHGQDTRSVVEVRRLSAALSDRDQRFMAIRNKIHIKPDSGDAAQVRAYAAEVRNAQLAAEYERLATKIDELYAPSPLAPTLATLARQLTASSALAQALQDGVATLGSTPDAAQRFAVTGQMMAALRDYLPQLRSAQRRLTALDGSLALEAEHFSAATVLSQQLPTAPRWQRLQWLQDSVSAMYGAGLLASRERTALRDAFVRLTGNAVPLNVYKTELDHLARASGWGAQRLRLHFYATMQKFVPIEPLADLFIQDQLRGSPLFFYANVLDSLLRDANALAGVRHVLFGQEVGAGLRGLNPGLARGTLRLAPHGSGVGAFEKDGIYLLPETVSDLPPVAGILTAGEGNALSHVQLLARNLGIPNVGVDERLIPQLRRQEGRQVILAVSPAGSVQMTDATGRWAALFGNEQAAPETLIRPDLNKLDLDTTSLIPLTQLRSTDSGRTVGPKAAKLGELYRHYPEAVAPGLAIPFGVFRGLLTQPMPGEGKRVFAWMVEQYTALATLPPDSAERRRATERFRQRLQNWLLRADAGAAFRQQLRQAMTQVFGPDGSYGVFVRSDTNVEDLPGFTGAGLNLTVPHVVGFTNVVQAISRVWASPFSARAFAWRQSHMDQPQHVYPAVLLLQSVPVEKSGVLVTQNIDTGQPGWLSVAINEGVGGAVDGQAAESLRINIATGAVRLLASATAPQRRQLLSRGGVAKVPVSGAETVLVTQEIRQLIQLAQELPQRFPTLTDAQGNAAPADIEFGFLKGQLRLFQIRPFLESSRARSSSFLQELDRGLRDLHTTTVWMHEIPKE